VAAGSNDFATSTTQTAAIVYGYEQTACTTFHSAGYKCYVLSLFPRGYSANGLFTNGQNHAGFEADRQALLTLQNAGVSTGWQSFADGFVDVADDPVIGLDSAAANANYFASDQTHLIIPQGQGFEAQIYARALGTYGSVY
jgi:hypothetical protein